MIEPLNEDLLERLYWEFDAERAKGSRSERDIFKGKMRYFAKHGHNSTHENIGGYQPAFSGIESNPPKHK